ncbi:putative holin [Hafnia alvei]|uniref:putative holin n=1 Tax=Hafnia alvei TaxID=569 RepID=UPI000621C5CF|nr:putative holin [Hafnia alvei]KKI45221.1 hypothetical protein XK86_09095 [Hafnia alvei]MDU7480807.1 putative holin [Hafnia alvei]
MSEPITAVGGFTAGSAGVTVAAFFPEATASVMICALAGAALYVLTADPHQLWKQIVFALISFVGGVYCAVVASEIVAALINSALSHLAPPVQIRITPAIGAQLASTISVTVLLRVLVRSKSHGSQQPRVR